MLYYVFRTLLEYYSEPLEQRTEDIDSPQQTGQTTPEYFYKMIQQTAIEKIP